MKNVPTYLFILSLVLILVAYFAGVQTDANAVVSGVNSTLRTATGRLPSGNFAGYPQGATSQLATGG